VAYFGSSLRNARSLRASSPPAKGKVRMKNFVVERPKGPAHGEHGWQTPRATAMSTNVPTSALLIFRLHHYPLLSCRYLCGRGRPRGEHLQVIHFPPKSPVSGTRSRNLPNSWQCAGAHFLRSCQWPRCCPLVNQESIAGRQIKKGCWRARGSTTMIVHAKGALEFHNQFVDTRCG